MRIAIRALMLSGTASILLWGSPAHAEPSAADRATARALAEEGGEALDKKNYEMAADRFGRADALVHAPTLSLELARAQVGLHKYVEAQETYQRILREGVPKGAPASFATAFQDAQKEAAAIPSKLGWVTLTVVGPTTFTLSVDAVEVPKAALGVKRAVNPGSHTALVKADGYLPRESQFVVGEGGATELKLTPDVDPAASAPKPIAPVVAAGSVAAIAPMATTRPPDAEPAQGSGATKTIGFVALGVGAAGLITGSIAGLVAISKHGELQSTCAGGKCPDSEQHTLDGYRTASTISTVGFIVGAVGTIGGMTMVLLAPKPTQAGAVTPFIGVASAGVEVTFR